MGGGMKLIGGHMKLMGGYEMDGGGAMKLMVEGL